MDYRDLGFELRHHLDSDEDLLWAGAPKQGIILKGTDAFMIPFSLMWGGFAFFWEFTAFNFKAPLFFLLWGIPFVLVGIYLIIGRFFYDAASRKNTIYGITPHRIIIKSGVFKKSIKSLSIRTLTDVTITEKSDGSGSIFFGLETGMSGMFRGKGWQGPANKAVPALELIPDVRKVYKQITDLQKGI